jgi:hypothetical protein
MSTKLKHQGHEEKAPEKKVAAAAPAMSNNVIAMPHRCAVKDCKKSPQLTSFCTEHYDWFKFGLITKLGEKPIDFDKKHQAYLKHKKAA